MATFEYMNVTETAVMLDKLMLQLNALGSVGWEVVGIAAADPTLGLNSYTVILKRPTLGWPTPATRHSGWMRDPTGRFDQRYWDGERWTQHVSAPGGVQDVDWPNRR